MDLGERVTFEAFYEDHKMGEVWLDKFVLKPGINANITVNGELQPSNLSSMGRFISSFIQGIVFSVIIVPPIITLKYVFICHILSVKYKIFEQIRAY